MPRHFPRIHSRLKESAVSDRQVTGRSKDQVKARIDGNDLRRMLAMGTTLLEENLEMVNSLNVFPVPDGDTGTNMVLTMQSAMEEVAKVSSQEFGAVAHAAAHGALMGARGNSGVILSQILRGLSRLVDGRPNVDAAELATALKEGANTAYRGIGKPVEGTILTVARESADAAVAAVPRAGNVAELLEVVVSAARTSVENTPNLLATLREAGVVDAGGQGLLLVFEGALAFLRGERTPTVRMRAKAPAAEIVMVAGSDDYGYCTEVLLRGERLRTGELRTRLERLGDSVIVVGEPDLVHLHVHTFQPGDVLNLVSTLGTMEKIKIENMQLQHTSHVANRQAEQATEATGTGVVAVAAGSGLARVFRDLGASVVVHGGQTMNPSIEELVHAVTVAGRKSVVLLPNNPNVILTAQQAKALANVDLEVVPTRTLCQGIAALVAFNAEEDLETNVTQMKDAASAVITIEMTHAVRTTKVNGMEVREGQAIGILDGALVEAGEVIEEVALRALEHARVAEHEMVTVYCGEGVSLARGRALADSIRDRAPRVEVDVMEGGQPHYPYLISVE